MLFSSRKRIIKKSVKATLQSVDSKSPPIYQNFFYGAYDLAPQHLVIWYLFETDAELEQAQNNGLCEELTLKTIENLKCFGYPIEAFSKKIQYSLNEKIKIQGTNEEIEKQFLDISNNQKACISFTTKEDIDRTTGGDYRLYFQ